MAKRHFISPVWITALTSFGVGVLSAGLTPTVTYVTKPPHISQTTTGNGPSQITSPPVSGHIDLKRGYTHDICGFSYITVKIPDLTATTLDPFNPVQCDQKRQCELISAYNIVACCPSGHPADNFSNCQVPTEEVYNDNFVHACEPHQPGGGAGDGYNAPHGTTKCDSILPVCATLTWTDMSASALYCQERTFEGSIQPTLITVSGDFLHSALTKTHISHYTPVTHYTPTHHHHYHTAAYNNPNLDSVLAAERSRFIGIVAGSVVGGVVSLALITAVWCFLIRQRKRRQDP